MVYLLTSRGFAKLTVRLLLTSACLGIFGLFVADFVRRGESPFGYRFLVDFVRWLFFADALLYGLVEERRPVLSERFFLCLLRLTTFFIA